MTQREAVMDYITKYDSITPMEAFQQLGITKLATVVSDMIRHDGAPIEKVPVIVKTRYGKTTRVMSYRLRG